mmetsp:Transcript_56334/g.123408  ORF Transcript_56334/g.123408 Transcript_56334/m.123408 type:complete len:272 (-) Transcript_56334:753-1568(-)
MGLLGLLQLRIVNVFQHRTKHMPVKIHPILQHLLHKVKDKEADVGKVPAVVIDGLQHLLVPSRLSSDLRVPLQQLRVSLRAHKLNPGTRTRPGTMLCGMQKLRPPVQRLQPVSIHIVEGIPQLAGLLFPGGLIGFDGVAESGGGGQGGVGLVHETHDSVVHGVHGRLIHSRRPVSTPVVLIVLLSRLHRCGTALLAVEHPPVGHQALLGLRGHDRRPVLLLTLRKLPLKVPKAALLGVLAVLVRRPGGRGAILYLLKHPGGALIHESLQAW